MILPGNLQHTLPKVIYDEIEGTIDITGRCVSPEVDSYFAEFLPYLRDCLKRNPMNMIVNVDLEFFSTRASKVIMEMFYILKEEIQDKKKFHVAVNWFFEEGDYDMQESGEDYEGLSHLDFKIIEKAE
jgi:hypothetical protein